MKRIFCVFVLCFILLSTGAQHPYLLLSTEKTTTIIFPLPVVHIDRGTAGIIVEQVRDAQHILLVKGGSKGF